MYRYSLETASEIDVEYHIATNERPCTGHCHALEEDLRHGDRDSDYSLESAAESSGDSEISY